MQASKFRSVASFITICEYPHRVLRDLPHLLHVNDRIMSQIRLKSFPSTTIPNHISPLRLQFDATDWTLKIPEIKRKYIKQIYRWDTKKQPRSVAQRKYRNYYSSQMLKGYTIIKMLKVIFIVSPCIFYIDLICTNLCTCIYECNITQAVTLVTLFAPTCFNLTGSSSGSLICPY